MLTLYVVVTFDGYRGGDGLIVRNTDVVYLLSQETLRGLTTLKYPRRSFPSRFVRQLLCASRRDRH